MASSQDGNLGLYSGYTAGDNGWTAQHNQNWDSLDALVQATVKSVTTTAPPGSPANGDAYIVPAGATGAWTSQTNKIAVWQARTGVAAWQFYSPKSGWQVYNQADSGDYVYNGTAWVLQGSPKLNVQQDEIGGLEMVWNSTSSISVTTGSAYIPALNRLSLVNSTLTLSSLSLSASTMYHVYLYENTGTSAIECVTTAPSSAYFGSARTKSGDTSRRYLGSIVTNSSGAIMKFKHNAKNGRIAYLENNQVAPLILALNGTSTTPVTVSCSAMVSPAATHVTISGFNSSSTYVCWIANPDCNFTVSGGGNFLHMIGQNGSLGADIPLSASLSINYVVSGTDTNGSNIRGVGYIYER